VEKARRSLVLALALVACSRRATPPATALTDEAGHVARLRAMPATRVVSLAANVTELLFAIGAGDRVVGVDSFSDAPAAARAMPRVGSEQEPSLERIVALRPDVVVTAMTANREITVQTLERMSVPVFVTRTETLSALAGTIRALGHLTGREAGAAALAAQVTAELDAVKKRAAALPATSALVVVWSDPLFVVGSGSYAADVLALAGGRNVAADAGPGFPKYSLERVLRADPAVILVGSHSGEAGDPMAYWKRWPQLRAVRQQRVVALDGDLLFRPGPRVAQGARSLFAALHGEARP
jgi:iron complex transport system substrate-binding protein